jgi:hypothetical protein
MDAVFRPSARAYVITGTLVSRALLGAKKRVANPSRSPADSLSSPPPGCRPPANAAFVLPQGLGAAERVPLGALARKSMGKKTIALVDGTGRLGTLIGNALLNKPDVDLKVLRPRSWRLGRTIEFIKADLSLMREAKRVGEALPAELLRSESRTS